MNKLYYILLLILFLSCNSNIYKNSINEFSDVNIKYKDGEIKNGKLSFPIFFNQDLLYLKSVKNKKSKIKTEAINEITYKSLNENIIFSKMNINGEEISPETKNSQFLQIISNGKLSLYKGYNYGFLHKKGKHEKFLEKTDLYYCKRENEQNLTLIYYVDNINNNDVLLKKKAEEYFSNYPEFRKSLMKKNYNPEFLITFINKYNNENK
jgi:hypothetical protein